VAELPAALGERRDVRRNDVDEGRIKGSKSLDITDEDGEGGRKGGILNEAPVAQSTDYRHPSNRWHHHPKPDPIFPIFIFIIVHIYICPRQIGSFETQIAHWADWLLGGSAAAAAAFEYYQ